MSILRKPLLVEKLRKFHKAVLENRGKKTNFVSINNVNFIRKIVPGERLDIEATLDSLKRGIAKGHAESFVNGEFACCAELVVTIPDVFNGFKPQQNKTVYHGRR